MSLRPTGSKTMPGLRLALPLGAVAALLVACGSADTSPASVDGAAPSTVRVLTNGVLGNDREPAQACGPEAAPDAEATDPTSIVAIGTGALDTVCALGLQDRVVGAAADGPDPHYLGPWAAETQRVGGDGRVDRAAIRAAAPELILVAPGPDGAAPQLPADLSDIAPVAVVEPEQDWTTAVRETGTALGRTTAIDALIDGYRAQAREAGAQRAAAQTQLSLLRFTDDAAQLVGPDSMPGRVLAEAGFRRPPGQRFTDADVRAVDPDDLADAEGDFMFLMFAGKNTGLSDTGGRPDSEVYGRTVMGSPAWEAIDVTAHRAWVVDDHVWFYGGGLIAAATILEDIAAAL